MLKYKDDYKNELENKLLNIPDSETAYSSYMYPEVEISVEFVSADNNNNVIGYFAADIITFGSKAVNLFIINFNKLSYTFSKDLLNFIEYIFYDCKINKIEWEVIVGNNRAEKLYDKFIKKYNGRIVGTRYKSVDIGNDQLCDIKLYEIFKEDFIKAKNKLKKE